MKKLITLFILLYSVNNGNWNVQVDDQSYQMNWQGEILWVSQNDTCMWGIWEGEQIDCPIVPVCEGNVCEIKKTS